MPNDRNGLAAGILALLIAACPACTAQSPSTDGLPSYGSLDEAVDAASSHLDCDEDPPSSTALMGENGQIPTSSVKCSPTVEIFYFDSDGARQGAYTVLAGTAEGDGSVYFAEGENWFVVDFSEVAAGGAEAAPMDLSTLSDELGARYTELS